MKMFVKVIKEMVDLYKEEGMTPIESFRFLEAHKEVLGMKKVCIRKPNFILDNDNDEIRMILSLGKKNLLFKYYWGVTKFSCLRLYTH